MAARAEEGFRLRFETQQIVNHAFDAIEALRSGKITPAQANKFAKVLRERQRSLDERASLAVRRHEQR